MAAMFKDGVKKVNKTHHPFLDTSNFGVTGNHRVNWSLNLRIINIYRFMDYIMK